MSKRKPFIDDDGQIDGIEHRTSYLLNSLLTHKTRRYGYWTLARFQSEFGLSNFVCMSERDAQSVLRRRPTTTRGRTTTTSGSAPRRSSRGSPGGRHTRVGQLSVPRRPVAPLPWQAAVLDMYPEKGVLIQDATFAQ